MIIGVTGGIGSGKSYVSKLLSQFLNSPLFSADEIVHQVTAPGGSAIKAIEKAFGAEYINKEGALDRPKMRELIFANPIEKKKLEDVTNYIINDTLHGKVNKALLLNKVVVVEIPLLYESEYWRTYCDYIVSVVCSKETQVKRVKARNGFEDQMILNIIGLQSSNEQRKSISNELVNNEEGVDLQIEIERVGNKILRLI